MFHILNKWPTRGFWNELGSCVIYKSSHHTYIIIIIYCMLYIFQVTTPAMLYNSTPSLVVGGYGLALGMLDGPRGVTVHHLTDVIYVADYNNGRVCEFNSSGQVISCMTGYRTVDGNKVDFNRPLDVSVMTDGRMIISDYHRVMLMYTNYTIIQVWGIKTAGQGLGQFNKPYAVASDGDLIYVADNNNARIQVLNVTRVDDMKQIAVTADDGSVSYKPRGVAVDPESGYMFVTGDRSGGDIMVIYNITGHYIRNVTSSDLGVNQASLYHIALYKDQVYITDESNDCIHIQSYTGTYIHRLGSEGTCPGCFQYPWGVAVHSVTGHVIVADYTNHNVQIFL